MVNSKLGSADRSELPLSLKNAIGDHLRSMPSDAKVTQLKQVCEDYYDGSNIMILWSILLTKFYVNGSVKKRDSNLMLGER